MIFSFIIFYFVGALIFFCHMSIIISKSVTKLSSHMHFTEEEQEQLFISFFPKILFQTVMMTIFPVSFGGYTVINSYFSDRQIVSSGLFTVIWLVITGILIKSVYYFATHNIKTLKVFDYEKYFQNKEFFWVTCPLLYGILFSLYNHTIFLTIFSIVLGKYIWMDSFRLISLSDIKIKVKEFLKSNKLNIHLLLCQTFVMGYLLVRWYPIKDELINATYEYTLNTFLTLAFFLMPIIDIFIFNSIKSYSGFIRKKD